MLRTWFAARSFRRRSISRTALRKAFAASFASVMIGVNRCGMPSYMPSSTRLGSTRIMRTCSGVLLNSTLMIMALMATDLPEPVEPAISTWGMLARSAVTMRPLMSLPSAMGSRDFDCAKLSHSTTSRSQMVSRSWLGTWMPTVDLPAMRSMRMDSAAMARQRSSAGPGDRAGLTPAAGDAGVFDAGVGAELEGSDDGAGVDLGDLAVDAELGALGDEGASFVAQ